MNKINIEKIYKKKIKLITEYNKFYYQNNNPKVSDKVYDELKKEILELEKDYKYLQSN